MSAQEIDSSMLYPWGGDFKTGDYTKNVAVVLLNIDVSLSSDVAISGHLKTENIGIEKIVANVISNPFIRFVIICGEDIRGHRSGQTLHCLHQHGIDENNRIINAPGAIPYIENIGMDAIKRFQEQVQIIDLINISDKHVINQHIHQAVNTPTNRYGDPFIAIQMVKEKEFQTDDKRALHSNITIQYMGKIEKRR